MNSKVFLINFLLGIFCVEYSRAARAGCEFGPMEGIEGKYLIQVERATNFSFSYIKRTTKQKLQLKFNLYFTDDIRGSATFIQIDPTKDLSIQVTGLHGLKSGKHGFHIHENGDCSDPGAHFNPEMVNVLKIIHYTIYT